MSNKAERDSGLTIGIDLGGTQVRAGLVARGEVLSRAFRQTDVAGGPDAVLAQFETLIGEILKSADGRAIDTVGVSAPGPLDSLSGVILGIPTLPGWANFPLQAAASQRLGLPVLIENDGIAAAFGEWRFGAGRGFDNLVYVTVSTGIGGGVVLDGRLVHGRRGMAGHVGHFRLAADGPRCSCGAIGCFEAFASGTALGQRARLAAAGQAHGYLAEASRNSPVEGRHVVAGARAGDATCIGLIDEEADFLGLGFTSLIHLFSPDIIVMGGGVSQAYDLMERRIHAIIARDAMAPFREVRVVPAALGDNAGLVGAAALAGARHAAR